MGWSKRGFPALYEMKNIVPVCSMAMADKEERFVKCPHNTAMRNLWVAVFQGTPRRHRSLN